MISAINSVRQTTFMNNNSKTYQSNISFTARTYDQARRRCQIITLGTGFATLCGVAGFVIFGNDFIRTLPQPSTISTAGTVISAIATIITSFAHSAGKRMLKNHTFT